MRGRNIPITPDRLIGKIEMLMSTGKEVVLVEGLNDVTFFKKMFSHKKSRIMDCNGKPNVVELVSRLKSKKQQNFIGLVDSDFDNYLSRNENEKLIKTDYHDIETMVIFDTKHFIDLIGSYTDFEKYEKSLNNNMIGFIIDLSFKIGLVRLINEEKQWSIDFSGYEVADLISNKNSKSKEDVFNYFCRDQAKQIEFLTQVEQKKLYPGNGELYKQICCGHDIIKITAHTINTYYKLKEIHFSTFEEVLRQKYTLDEFTKTSMYEKIKEHNEDLLDSKESYFTFESIPV